MNANKMKAAASKKDKDRPKSSDKLKGKYKPSTPDKPTTPGPDDDSLSDNRSSVLNDEEIQGMAIRQDALIQVRQDAIAADTVPRAPKSIKPVNVRKVNANPPPKRVTTSITVAKGAPPRAPLKPVETEGNSGPRFDRHGNVIAHSILGTLEEYKFGAESKGELVVDYYIREQDRVHTPATLPKQKPILMKAETRTQPMCESTEESNALVHWQKKMRERKLQQGYISRLLQKPESKLVMNRGDNYREKQELRHLIDRSIPAVDYGKGYRVGSEFWAQKKLIGDEEKGIHMTLTQTEQGYPPPIEHVEIPNTIRREKGVAMSRPGSASNKPWHRSQFLRERVAELGPVMHDLDPHPPFTSGLEVIGTNNPYSRYIAAATPFSDRPESVSDKENAEDDYENMDPLAEHPDVYSSPIFGPAIRFAGEILQWAGDGHSSEGKIAVDARVTFETFAGCRSTSFLEIINLGTTAMYFSWKMLPKSNPFDLVNSNVQRFYFNTSSGVILPGHILKFPFVFKSDKAGVFCEQWQFQTHPVVAGGAALVVTLRGVALREDSLKKQRDLIEAKLQKNIIWKNMRRLIEDIVSSIKSPDRPKSPVDSYLTEQDKFQRQNPQLYYKHEVVEKLRELHKMLMSPPTMDGGEDEEETTDGGGPQTYMWNLNVTDFKKEVLSLDVDDERRPAFLETINESVMQLSFPYFNPQLQKMYKSCYQYLSNTVDNMCGHSMRIRHMLGLPEKECGDISDDASRLEEISFSPRHSISRRLSSQSSAKTVSAGKKRLSVDHSAGVVGSGSTTSATGGRTAAPKSTPKATIKEEKKVGKEQPAAKKDAKTKEAAKKSDRASPTKKNPPAKAPAPVAAAAAVEERATPSSLTMEHPSSPTEAGVDAKLEMKYKEKLYIQAYLEMHKLIGDIVDAFEEIKMESSS